uniref:Uncharacterized protein n=1 Tax=Romanomermis culicivorax TaxID=13658 RepID=A0A915L854_ROMCU
MIFRILGRFDNLTIKSRRSNSCPRFYAPGYSKGRQPCECPKDRFVATKATRPKRFGRKCSRKITRRIGNASRRLRRVKLRQKKQSKSNRVPHSNDTYFDSNNIQASFELQFFDDALKTLGQR